MSRYGLTRGVYVTNKVLKYAVGYGKKENMESCLFSSGELTLFQLDYIDNHIAYAIPGSVRHYKYDIGAIIPTDHYMPDKSPVLYGNLMLSVEELTIKSQDKLFEILKHYRALPVV